MSVRTPIYSIVLAAGKGRRMRNQVCHKVCFQIAGIPAIHRALDAYNRIGVTRNVIVVGDLAGQVVETVGRKFRNVVFAYQPDALGTGDAARCGLQALSEISPEARILVVAGDKIIDNATLTRLVERCEETDADLGVLVSPATWGGESAGRVLFDSADRPLAIVESADIRLRACRAAVLKFLNSDDCVATADDLRTMVTRHLGKSGMLETVFEADLSAALSDPIDRRVLSERLRQLACDFRFDDSALTFTAAEAQAAPWCNESVYLVRKRALDFGLEFLPSRNAQGELYLTDGIGAIFRAGGEQGPRFRVCHVPTTTQWEVLSYNNPEELLHIEDFFQGRRRQTLEDLQARLGPQRMRTVRQWLELFPEQGQPTSSVSAALAEFYGTDPTTLQERCHAYRAALTCFRDNFGEDRHAILVRSPGRINVMGRHIDWQGGRCNLMAVSQECVMVVSPRSDDAIEARNVHPDQFPDVSISLGQLVSWLNWDDWLSVVNSGELLRHLRESAGNWSLYIEAAMLRLQMAYRDRQFCGMDLAVCGNIPVAAGLSSSSAIVVATAESALALHDLDITPRQFVNFCGEGEWFVGTRGGSADHAAMKYGARSTINHVKFHDFELLQQLAFPATHTLVVCNSHVQARKAGGARQAFNSRVGSYLAGIQLVRSHFRQYAALIQFVRDISPEVLQVPPSRIYEILMALPETITAAEVRRRFQTQPDHWATLSSHFDDVPGPTLYPVRGVVMFGVAECQRAIRAADCLARGDMEELGALMTISHNGERCFTTRPDGTQVAFETDISDRALQALIADLTSQDLQRTERAQLYNQPGAYRCSTPEIDAIVDTALRTPGVAGAQIAGAGLGGCAMILVRNDAVTQLEHRLNQDYFQPRDLPPGTIRCLPSAGSGLLAIGGNP